MEEKKMNRFIAGFACGCLAGSLVSTAIEMAEYRARVRQLVQERMEVEAVMTGHAEWLEGKDGKPMFSWREKCR
jgi:phage tail tape-measure protein